MPRINYFLYHVLMSNFYVNINMDENFICNVGHVGQVREKESVRRKSWRKYWWARENQFYRVLQKVVFFTWSCSLNLSRECIYLCFNI